MKLFIDLKDFNKKKSGSVLDAKHLPKGLLEFWINLNSPYHKKFNFILYFSSNWRIALAILTTSNINLLNTFHLIVDYNE